MRTMFSGQDMVDVMTYLGQAGEGVAKQHAPVDTGNLRRSITHEVGKRDGTLFTRIGTNVRYGIYQELGTRYHAAHPYLRPAMESLRNIMGGY